MPLGLVFQSHGPCRRPLPGHYDTGSTFIFSLLSPHFNNAFRYYSPQNLGLWSNRSFRPVMQYNNPIQAFWSSSGLCCWFLSRFPLRLSLNISRCLGIYEDDGLIQGLWKLCGLILRHNGCCQGMNGARSPSCLFSCGLFICLVCLVSHIKLCNHWLLVIVCYCKR